MANNGLSASALLALAAASQSQALSAPDYNEIRYRISHYQQRDFPANRISSGSTQAYQIDIQQLGWRQKLADNWVFTGAASYESMSGASPLQTFSNSSGQSQVIMSGASIEEQRRDLRLSSEHYFSRGLLAAGYYQSDENDYQAKAGNLRAELELNSALTTLAASYAYSRDRLNPSEPQLSVKRQQARGEIKQQSEGYVSLTQVLNKYEVVQLSIGRKQISGYLDDPYRNIDSRPSQRLATISGVNYRFYMKPWSGAYHLDYRYYQDDWQVRSHTLKLSWLQDINSWLRWRIGTRYYRQQQAGFYSLDATQTSHYQTNDARLSAYGALEWSAGIDLTLAATQLSFDWQSYRSSEDWGPTGDNRETPTLIHYDLWSVAIRYRY